ncbi:MAG TPA: multicopper oxidase domain-containing protein [Longimicrobiales bacterium]|nr:multicopper oxidase domain-containing protein [Longimicrobiales bacterium]
MSEPRSTPDEGRDGIGRRHFVRLGATGLAVSAAGCASASEPPGAAAGAPAGGVAAATPEPSADAPPAGDGPPPFPPPPPEVDDDLVDPEELSGETWQEPWIWRQDDWTEDALELNVVQVQNPGRPAALGNRNSLLFSYNGTSPAPTIRARGDTTVHIRIRNHLDTNHQLTPVGPCPDPFEYPPAMLEEVCRQVTEEGAEEVADCDPFELPVENFAAVPARLVPGYLLGHANGSRTAHVTNLHLHGLHVPPQFNPDGTISDNVLLRILPKGDWERRKEADDPSLRELKPHERVGAADFAVRLGEARHGAPEGSPRQPHPPGTYWYHPHPHGSTHEQVSSGMAGFFIIEGDVDDAVNQALAGTPRPHPEEKTGPYDYRERLMLFQRAIFGSFDLDSGPRRQQLRLPDGGLVNGEIEPSVATMRPGAIERWRVLNASVDGSGFKRFMVLEGQYVRRGPQIFRVEVEEGDPAPEGGPDGDGGGGQGGPPPKKRKFIPVSPADIEAAKAPLYLLAFDGITLVEEDANGRPRHAVQDLSRVNAGTESPLARRLEEGEDFFAGTLKNFEECYRNGDTLNRAYNRPNEVYMATANRADVLFKAPLDGAGKVYTIFAQEVEIDSDNMQQALQRAVLRETPQFNRPVFNIVVGWVHVRGEPVEGGDFDVMSLTDVLPPVPPFLHPVREDELRAPAAETRARGVREGSLRTRVVAYSGYGGPTFPLVHVPEEFAAAHPELEKLIWYRHEGVPVLLPNYTRTMAIHPRFDLAANPDPGLPRKFSPDHPEDSKVLLGSAEEWVLYNNSLSLWAYTDNEKDPQQGQYDNHFLSYPVQRAEGQRRFAEDPSFRFMARGADHPFHIHINPMWVIRIDVPDENGVLHNVLPQPRWMDTVPIPRNGGRVVFRSRFLDFTGTWIHHCHILLHEDNGMMQTMHCVDDPADADWMPRRRVASHDMDGREVDAIYPPPSLELQYRQSMAFVDPSVGSEQEYPGFELGVPSLPERTASEG